jgi:tRNA A37 threonylcarbamoyladenosine biosynthesis protein TsaE
MIHIDLYRIETFAEAEEAGLLDVFDADAIVVVEWPEKIAEVCEMMPHVKVAIDACGPDSRLIRIIEHR